MGSGYAGHGGVPAQINGRDHKTQEGRLSIRSEWNHAGNWLSLNWWPAGEKLAFTIDIDADNGDDVELVAALLEAIGNEDLANKVRDDSAAHARQWEIRQEAEREASAAVDAAREELLDATAEQRAAFDAKLDDIERRYKEKADESMRWGRSLDWGERSLF